jgi:hypothetical protein
VLNALVLDRRVCDSLLDRHQVNKRKLLNAWISDPQAIAAMTDEQRDKFETAIKDLPSTVTKDPINIAALADRSGLGWLYNTVYRMTSSDAAHTTLDALTLHLRVDAAAEIAGLTFGPRIEKLGDTLIDAMNCLLFSMHAVSSLFSMSDLQPQMEQHLHAIKRLSDAR